MILRSADGTLIFCESLLVPKARGDLLVVHGLGEYSGRYHELAAEAHSLRLNVHLFDLRGHGRSQGTRGHFTAMDEHHQDMEAWLDHLVGAGRLAKVRPCFLLGHSLGGLIALTYCANYIAKPLYPELTGLILSSPLLGVPNTVRRLLESSVAKRVPAFFKNIQIPTGIKSSELSHDKEEMRAYDEDPLVHGWITPSAFLAMEKSIRGIYDLMPKLNLPIFFLLSGKDSVVDNASSQRFIQKLSVAHRGRVEVKVFQRFFHEAFHEAGRDRAFLELKKWILKQLTSLKKSSSLSSGKKVTERETSL